MVPPFKCHFRTCACDPANIVRNKNVNITSKLSSISMSWDISRYDPDCWRQKTYFLFKYQWPKQMVAVLLTFWNAFSWMTICYDIDSNFTEICPQESHWQLASIDSDNWSAPNRRQAIISTIVGFFINAYMRHICVTRPRWVKVSLSFFHCSDVIMSAMASQITSVSIVYSTVCSGEDQRKHQGAAPVALEWPVNSPHRGLVTLKMFPFDDVIILKL